MAKTKSQKNYEAQFRIARGNLVDAIHSLQYYEFEVEENIRVHKEEEYKDLEKNIEQCAIKFKEYPDTLKAKSFNKVPGITHWLEKLGL